METSKGKKLLVWGHSSNQQGGGEQDLTIFLSYFAQHGHFELLGTFPSGPRKQTNENFCKASITHRGGLFPIINESLLNYFIYWIFGIKQIIQTRKFLHKMRPDGTLFFSSASLAPFLYSLTIKTKRYLFVREEIKPAWLMRLIFRKLYCKANIIFTVSDFLKSVIETFEIRTPIHSIYSLPIITIPKVKMEKRSSFRIACIGVICKNKGQLKLLAACHLLENPENIELHFFGNIPTYRTGKRYYNRLKDFQKNNPSNVNVRFHGNTPQDKLIPQLAGFDLIAIPSEAEGLSLVLLEAILLSVPVIASRIGEMKRLIEHGFNGMLFEPDDIAAIANCIARMLNDRVFYNNLRSNLGTLPEYLGTLNGNLRKLLTLIENDLG